MDSDFSFQQAPTQQDTGKIEVSKSDIEFLMANLKSPVYVEYDSKYSVDEQAAEIRKNRIECAIATMRGWL